MNSNRREACLALALVLLLCCAAAGPVFAQSAEATGGGRAEMTPVERAQRDADKVFKWIRIQADKSAQRAPTVARAAAPTKPPLPSGAKSMAGVDALESDDASVDPEPRSEAIWMAAARLVTRTIPPLPTAPMAASPEPELTLPLKLLSKVEPEMPRQLQPSIRTGLVLVRFTVLPDGRVAAPEVMHTTNQRMSAAALEAVKQWRFAPITEARTATVEIGFKRD